MDAILGVLRAVSGVPRIEAIALVLARVMPVIVATPVFAGPQAPQTVRIGAGLLLALAIAPGLGAQPMPEFGFEFGLAMGSELATGITIAVAVRLVFEIVAGTGDLIDVARDVKFANFIDPWTQAQSSPLGPFLLQLELATFASLGGLGYLAAGLARSYRAIPPGHGPGGATGDATVAGLTTLAGETFLLAIRLAIPAVATMFIVDIALGLLNRIAPLGPGGLFFLGFTLKPWLGLLIVFFSAAAIVTLTIDDLPRLLAPFITE